MKNMSRALTFALVLGTATAAKDIYEWKGVFYTPDNEYKWGAEKVDGKYADATMQLAAIPVGGGSLDALNGVSGKATSLLSNSCEAVQSGGTLTATEAKCYKLIFDQSSSQSLFTIKTGDKTHTAFFAEHVPTEFEAKEHYFKDKSGTDIEPLHQAPEGGHGHDHGHGHGHSKKGSGLKCVCVANQEGWKLDCSKKQEVQKAVDMLKATPACKVKDPAPSDDCKKNYHVMQAHHDHCLHDALPAGIEKLFHEYENVYDDCFVKRQIDTSLSKCPEVDCSVQPEMTKAITILQGGCASKQACADSTCAASIKTVLMAHDTCKESELPNNLETALHDYEDPCAEQLCNTGDATKQFDPYEVDQCNTGDVSSAGGLWNQKAPLVTLSALPFALCFWLS